MSIENILAQYETQIMGLPNVVGIGIGEKGGRAVIKVFVEQKLPDVLLKPDERVPKMLGDYQTDVEEIGAISALL